MKFILNTTLDPHFCVLFDERGFSRHEWQEHRRDGEEVFDFLREKKVDLSQIDFCGGISGPGGFSSLRAGAGILNSIVVANKIQVHQIRADKFLVSFLKSENFALNSFGDSVWLVQKGELVRFPIDVAVQKFAGIPCCVRFLPEEKQKKFARAWDVSLDGIEQALLKSLESEKSRDIFLPDYEFPAV